MIPVTSLQNDSLQLAQIQRQNPHISDYNSRNVVFIRSDTKLAWSRWAWYHRKEQIFEAGNLFHRHQIWKYKYPTEMVRKIKTNVDVNVGIIRILFAICVFHFYCILNIWFKFKFYLLYSGCYLSIFIISYQTLSHFTSCIRFKFPAYHSLASGFVKSVT